MKTLILMRHAKSSWDDTSLADFDRPLNDRGRSAAPFMGLLLVREGLIPDVIVSSPARRARETAELVKEAAGFDAEMRFDDRVYEASPQTLVRVLAETGEEHKSAMLVGHNPGMEGVIRLLTGSSEPMPTAAAAVLKIDLPGWSSLDADVGGVEGIYRPKAEMAREGRP